MDDIYGELPSVRTSAEPKHSLQPRVVIFDLPLTLAQRIFATLLNKGRSTIPQLAYYTSLTPRQLRHGLVVLLQNNLLYFQVESGHAIYTANSMAAYDLIRTGKVLDMMSSAYGEAEKEVVQNLLSMGYAKVENLREAYTAKFKQAKRLVAATNGATNGHFDHDEAENGGDLVNKRTGLAVRSLEHLDEILCRLIQVDLVTSVAENSFRSWEDTKKAVEEEVTKNFFAGGVRGTKGKEDFASKLSKRLREVRDEPLGLKRRLQAKLQMNKRRKVSEWNSVNAGFDDDSDLIIDVCASSMARKYSLLTLRRATLFCGSTLKSVLLSSATSSLFMSCLKSTARPQPKCMRSSSSSSARR